MTCFHPKKKLYLAVSRNHVDLIIKAHIQTTRARVKLSLCELGEGQGLDRERVQRVHHAHRHQYQAFHFHFINLSYVLIILKCMYFVMLISLKWKETIIIFNSKKYVKLYIYKYIFFGVPEGNKTEINLWIFVISIIRHRHDIFFSMAGLVIRMKRIGSHTKKLLIYYDK